jgi:hypothetical protein
MLNQILFSQGAEYTFAVMGNEASITVKHLQFSQYTSSDGTFKYVLDEDGVSTVTATSWAFLNRLKLVVDGAAYTNGSQTIKLIDADSILPDNNPGGGGVAGFQDPASQVTVTNFAPGVIAEVIQDIGNGDILLEITDTTETPLEITSISVNGAGDVDLSFVGTGSTTYYVEKTPDLTIPFGPTSASGTTDGGGAGAATVDASELGGSDAYFFRMTD